VRGLATAQIFWWTWVCRRKPLRRSSTNDYEPRERESPAVRSSSTVSWASRYDSSRPIANKCRQALLIDGVEHAERWDDCQSNGSCGANKGQLSLGATMSRRSKIALSSFGVLILLIGRVSIFSSGTCCASRSHSEFSTRPQTLRDQRKPRCSALAHTEDHCLKAWC